MADRNVRSTYIQHRGDDGRGPRRVTVDGRVVDRVLVADEDRGVVQTAVGLNGRRNRLLTRAIYGVVKVEPIRG